MRRSAILLLLASCATRVAPPDQAIGWRDAAACVGHFCSIRGRIAETTDEGPVIRLYFDGERRDVYVTLVRGWLVTWPSYTGREIEVTGPVDAFHGATEILIDDPGAIAVLDAPPPEPAPPPTVQSAAEPTLAPAPPVTPTIQPTAPTPTPGEVEQLRERMRELEERLRELEQEAPPGR